MAKRKDITINFKWKNTIPKICIWSVFHIVKCEKAKMHAKHPIWGKERTFKETCLLSVYERVRHQNVKKY